MAFEIGKDEMAILNCLIHPESLDVLFREVELSEAVIRDVLLNLIHHNYVYVLSEDGKKIKIFDKDRLFEVRFGMTAKGLNAWSLNQKGL